MKKIICNFRTCYEFITGEGPIWQCLFLAVVPLVKFLSSHLPSHSLAFFLLTGCVLMKFLGELYIYHRTEKSYHLLKRTVCSALLNYFKPQTILCYYLPYFSKSHLNILWAEFSKYQLFHFKRRVFSYTHFHSLLPSGSVALEEAENQWTT